MSDLDLNGSDETMDAHWNYRSGYQDAVTRLAAAFGIGGDDLDTDGDEVENLLARLPREAVLRFAGAMERQLREHDDRPGWEGVDPAYLIWRCHQELIEVQDECRGRPDAARVIAECADVANFAMMLADIAPACWPEVKR